MWIERRIANKLRELSNFFPVVILTGARQTGKTSLLKRVFPEYNYVSLDLRILAEQAESSPESFLRDHPPPVVIDEIQYAPELFRHLKIVVDKNREKKGQYILTGSQKFTLMKGVSESLAGRCALLSLPGLTVGELKGAGYRFDGTERDEAIIRGQFPELWADRDIPSRDFYQAYVSTYLERDLRQMLNVGSLRDFERFLRACAARVGQLLNKSELARDVGISASTAGEWISVLEASNQIFLLEPFFANVGKRLVKSPKMYFQDTGLLWFLLGLGPESLGKTTLTGAIWENFVVAELKKYLELSHPEWSLWYYRDQQNREADCLIQGPYERVRILDAKWSEMPRIEAFTALGQIAKVLGNASGIDEFELGLISRNSGIKVLGGKRQLISGFELDRYVTDAG